MYIVLSTAVVLLASVFFAVYQQKKIKVSVVAREEVNEKDFFAVRVESEDFLFVRDEMKDVAFVQALDDVDEFSIKNLAEKNEVTKETTKVKETLSVKAPETETKAQPKTADVISLRDVSGGGKLVMPKSEKKVS